jgi:hypothetical protein
VDIRAWDLPEGSFVRARAVATVGVLAFWCTVVGTTVAFARLVATSDIHRSVVPTFLQIAASVIVLAVVIGCELAMAVVLRNATEAEEGRNVSGALLGLCARTIILLDGACLAIYAVAEGGVLWWASACIFGVSVGALALVQLRLLLALFRSNDWFSLDRPDRCFRRGRAPLRGYAPPDWNRGDELTLSGVQAIKLTNLVLAADFFVLYEVLYNQYLPLSYQETAEFASSVACFTRCFVEDVVQCIIKVVFLLEFDWQPVVVIGLILTILHHTLLCCYLFSGNFSGNIA